MQASVVIAFYNKVKFLELVLAGFERQSINDFEVIIADDGSRSENVKIAKDLLAKLPVPSTHLWQEDVGFRKNIMLNRAIMTAKSDVIIFVDGDCIPHSHFVEEHAGVVQPGVCATGRRVLMSQKLSEQLTADMVREGFLENSNWRFYFDAWRGHGSHSGQGQYIEARWLRKLINLKDRGVLGSNFSVHKKDLLAVNGFDERYVHPAVGEDTDIEFRLRLNGVKVQSLINVANQYHLYHKLLEREEENPKLFAKVKEEKKFFTPFGIKKSAG